MPKSFTVEEVPADVIAECSQLTKANSIEGCKLSHVHIIYTPWANLRKDANMADGQVGYHDRSKVRHTVVEHRINAVVKALEKTKVEKHNNPSELERLRRQRDEEVAEEERQRLKAERKQQAVDKEAARERVAELEASKVETLYGMENIDEKVAAELLARTEEKIADTIKSKTKKGKNYERGAGVDDASLVDDLFGGGGGLSGGAGGGWGASSDSDDGFGGQVELADVSDIFGADGDAAAGRQKQGERGEGLGALGLEAEAVAKQRKSVEELEKLTQVAHERKADAKAKAIASKTAREEAATAKDKAMQEALSRSHDSAKASLVRGIAAADAALDTARQGGSIDTVFDENRARQEEELMVLEAIFADALKVDDGGDDEVAGGGGRGFELRVEGDGHGGGPTHVLLRVDPIAAYPSHLPPHVSVREGVSSADAPGLADTLRGRYFEHRETLDADEPGECIVHHWVEWLRDEWMPVQRPTV
jgi:hypothetical protein